MSSDLKPKTIILRYVRLMLLVGPYLIIIVSGHGFAPLGLLLFLGSTKTANIKLLGWLGLAVHGIAPLVTPRRFYPLVVTIGAVILVLSVQALLALYAGESSASVDRGYVDFFYLCSFIFLVIEWALPMFIRWGHKIRGERSTHGHKANELITWDCPKCQHLNPNSSYKCLQCGYSLV